MVVALVMDAAGSRRAIARVIEEATCGWFEEPVADEKRRRLVKWKRCVSGIASGTSREILFIVEISVVSWWSATASFCLVGTVSFWMFLENATTGCCVWFCCEQRLVSIDRYLLFLSSVILRTAAVGFKEAVERLVEKNAKLLVCEDFWRNLTERSLSVVRFWIHVVTGRLLSCRMVQRYHRSGDRLCCLIGIPPSCDGLTGLEYHGPMIPPVDLLCGFRGSTDFDCQLICWS
ncbi:hypothetical protein F511_17960 [Dorcoceras hygrometricum]|uniref:Uncharacterized protein n=1 Tax=Dorcoceras hygrometricum TaxID=472368 RepID=A0A2Z7AK75_9LAMI|nr:hypothetical protein F511_17960 [Dorcoceras hygrometricum]